MDKILQFYLIVLLIPGMAEILDADKFSITMQGLPLTLGRLLFVVAGVSVFIIMGNFNSIIRTNTFKGFFLIFFGLTIGALLQGDISGSLSKTAGQILLFVSSCGFVSFLDKKYIKIVIDVFFICLLIYWLYYTFNITLLNGKHISYTLLYNDGKALNHHIPGLYISVSSVYVAIRFFYHSQKISRIGILIIILAVFACLLLESRSNTLFVILAFIAILLNRKKSLMTLMFLILPMIFAFFYLLELFISQYSFLMYRFDLNNFEYHVKSFEARFLFLKESFNIILEHPFGRGIDNIKLQFGANNFFAHNQFLSFIIAGGVFALFGVTLWLKDLFVIFKQMFDTKSSIHQNSVLLSMSMSLFVFSVTLFTIEKTGLFFFLMISVNIFISKHFQRES